VQLATAPAIRRLGLEQAVGDVLDRRLQARHPRSIAMALSGGGDSLALLLAAAAWAERAGRELLVLTVDHGLRAESADWTRTCAATARRLGLAFRALSWTGEKPATGLPAAARLARHRLLADAAREAGARVILMGHTASDIREAAAMRAAGSTTPDPREWSPSPVWPQGRGLFILRPMLGVARADIRDWLTARGETWIDDPANADLAYARPRARQALAASPPSTGAAPQDTSAAELARACRPEAEGGLRIDRALLRAADPEACRRFVSAACLSAAGTDRPPRREKLARLVARLASDDRFTATLAGARIEADATLASFRREPGEAARGGLAPLRLAAGETGVWDRRFEITAEAALEACAAPGSAQPTVAGRPLAYERLLAACGAVEREPA
jgi:tRNA(Ile)-lysidine synthase